MNDITDLEDFIDIDDGHVGYPRDTDDALFALGYSDAYDPDWYMEMPDCIRSEFESADRYGAD